MPPVTGSPAEPASQAAASDYDNRVGQCREADRSGAGAAPVGRLRRVQGGSLPPWLPLSNARYALPDWPVTIRWSWLFRTLAAGRSDRECAEIATLGPCGS
jgi:hypothetical protein